MKKILRYLSVKQLMEDIADLNGVMSVRRFCFINHACRSCCIWCMFCCTELIISQRYFVMILAVIMIPGLVRNYFYGKESKSVKDLQMWMCIFTR